MIGDFAWGIQGLTLAQSGYWQHYERLTVQAASALDRLPLNTLELLLLHPNH
jgi:hypothetical protein